MLKGWCKKSEAIKRFKSTMCQAWINTNYNKWVPCIIQELARDNIVPEIVKVRFSDSSCKNMPLGGQHWEIFIDSKYVMFSHKILKSSLPLRHYNNFMSIIHNLDT